MSEPIPVKALEQLKVFRNKKDLIEIVLRDQKGRIKTIQKIMISDLSKTQEKAEELTKKVVDILNEHTHLSKKTLKNLGNVAKLEKIDILLNGLNLCSTCAGFAILYAKLDAMSAEINHQLYQLQKTVKQAQEIQNDYEFNKVLAEHTDMLDSQRKQHPYSEEKMRELVDREYNILMLLISSFQKDIAGDHGALIFSIFSMLAMFTVSLRTFDELYYFNNHQVLGEKDVWHLAHEKWMGVYDTLSSGWFVEKLQDYGTFETKLTTAGVDVYYLSLMDQVADLRSEIEDNQTLIVAIGDPELFRQYKEISAKEVADSIEAAFREAGSDLDEETVTAAYQHAMQQAAMA